MRYINFFIAAIVILILEGCASLDCLPYKGGALPGTDTAVVALYIDKNGYPQASLETIKVYPGQKIIFAGPDRFEILFKDQKSPIGKLEVQSNNGTIVIEIPRDIFELDQRESKTTEIKKELLYRYGIRVNGKLTDPNIIID